MGPRLLEDLVPWLDAIEDPQKDLPDEAACRRRLADIRFHGAFACPKCGHEHGFRYTDVWRCKRCRHRCSVTAHTIMHNTHLPLRLWLAAFWYLTHWPNGISALRFQHKFNLPSYESVLHMFHKIRSCFDYAGPTRAQLQASTPSSTACIQILGRARSGKPELQAFVALGLTRNDLEHVEAPTSPAALDGLSLGADSVHKAAHMLAESFRTAINGIHHGVTPKYLPLYAREFFGRWRSALVDVDVLERMLADRRSPPRRTRLLPVLGPWPAD